MKLIFFLISSQLVLLINANIITSGNGVSVAGHLNRDGLSSTVIKTQQLNDEEQRRNLVQSDLASSFADETLDNEIWKGNIAFYGRQTSPRNAALVRCDFPDCDTSSKHFKDSLY